MSRRGEGDAPPFRGPIERIGVVVRSGSAELDAAAREVCAFASENGLEVLAERQAADGLFPGSAVLEDAEDAPDLLLTLGGDGTLLRGARIVASSSTPVLGVNLGQLGFLTSLAVDELRGGLAQVLRGETHLDLRFTLEARVVREDGSRDEPLWAMNDLAVHKRGVARVVRLGLTVDGNGGGEEIGSFSGDGVVVATPTGSTAYSLSAGGPVIVPSMECLVVTPISPHTLAMRPLVLPAGCRLSIDALDRAEELVVTADGQVAQAVAPTDRVEVVKGEQPVPLVRFPGQTFFQTLRRKLNWAV